MDRLYYEPGDVQALTCGAYAVAAPPGSGAMADGRYRVWYRGLSWLADADKLEKHYDDAPWWDRCWKARGPGIGGYSCDGVPREIHAIEDKTARDAARLAWRQEAIGAFAKAMLDVRYGMVLSNWFPCWEGVQQIAWLNLQPRTIYKLYVSAREDDPSRASFVSVEREMR